MSESNMIVTVMYQSSVVAKGIEKKLADWGYQVISVIGDFSSIDRYIEHAGLYLLYLPTDILDDQKKLAQLDRILDSVVKTGKNMICVGETKFHSDLERVKPILGRYVWVDRPIDMEKFEAIVDNAITSAPLAESKKRILIVDDDPSYAKMVREWIKEFYRVDIVTAGMQAISFLLKVSETQGEQVDLILLDYEMPIVDGPQVFQMLKQESATAKIPVIFLTGIGTKEAVARVMELKPDGYVLKSTSRADLLGYLSNKLK